MKKLNKNYTILGDVKTTYELYTWFNVLVAGNESRKSELSVIFDQTGNAFSTIMKYRRKLLQNNPMQQVLNMENIEQFREQLEQMFWEPISLRYSETIKKIMLQNKWTVKALMNEHLKNPERRVWTIICCKNGYIAC